ncbi:MAG: hypothetical protein AAF806_26645 [Bacteroidota bacterium]
MLKKQNTVPVTPKTRTEIAQEYSISYKTLMRRLKKCAIELPSGLLFSKEQKIVYECLGYPSERLRRQLEAR